MNLNDDLEQIVEDAYKHQKDIKDTKLKKHDEDEAKLIALKDRYNLEVVGRFLKYAECIKEYVKNNKEISVIDQETLMIHKIIEIDTRTDFYNHCTVFLADEKFISDDLKEQFKKDMNYMLNTDVISNGIYNLTDGVYTKFSTFNYGGVWYFFFKLSRKECLNRVAKKNAESLSDFKVWLKDLITFKRFKKD